MDEPSGLWTSLLAKTIRPIACAREGRRLQRSWKRNIHQILRDLAHFSQNRHSSGDRFHIVGELRISLLRGEHETYSAGI